MRRRFRHHHGPSRVTARFTLETPPMKKKVPRAEKFCRGLELFCATARFGARTAGFRTRRPGFGYEGLESFCPASGKFCRTPGCGARTFTKSATAVGKKAITAGFGTALRVPELRRWVAASPMPVVAQGFAEARLIHPTRGKIPSKPVDGTCRKGNGSENADLSTDQPQGRARFSTASKISRRLFLLEKAD